MMLNSDVNKQIHPQTRLMLKYLNREREGAGPLSDLLAQSQNLRHGLRGDLSLEVLELVGLLGEFGLDSLADVDRLIDIAGNTLEVLLAHTTGSHGRGTDTNTVGSKSRLVTRDRVLVASNVNLFQDSLETSTVQSLRSEIQENHVAISAVSNELVAKTFELVLDSLGVLDNLLLVCLELGGIYLLKGDGKSGDGVVVRTTLMTREDREVNGSLEVIHDVLSGLGVLAADTLAEEDHGTTGSTEGLVGSGGYNVGILKGRGNDASSDQTGDVSHINDEVGANLLGDLAHALVVNQTAVGGGTGDQALGAVELSVGLQSVVVNNAGFKVDTVGEGFEVGGDGRDPADCH